jgi:phospholipid transport system substrate-binding protein
MINRRALLAGFAAACLALGAAAQTPASPSAAIAAFDDAIMMVMRAGKTVPFAQRMAMLTPVVEHVFDLPTLLKNSVGPARWNSISEPQKAELLDAFTKFTVSSYVGNFDAYDGEKFIVAPELRHVGHDVVVSTRLVGNAGDLARLDYVMRESAGIWRVVDILLDGSISRVAVTRSDFRSLLGQGDAAPLIASLRAKAAGMAAGTSN